MTLTYYQTGNTVRLQCTFKNFDNIAVDPDSVKVVFYNDKYEKFEEFILNSANRISTGNYFFDYIADEEKNVYYEWYAEIEGTPFLKRSKLSFRFV
ncbi:MAG: hypothetical protein ACOWWO_11925 [Peptococcaceae bacterium]